MNMKKNDIVPSANIPDRLDEVQFSTAKKETALPDTLSKEALTDLLIKRIVTNDELTRSFTIEHIDRLTNEVNMELIYVLIATQNGTPLETVVNYLGWLSDIN